MARQTIQNEELAFSPLWQSLRSALVFDRVPRGPWFKYTASRWADELTQRGKVRLGTLLDYRKTERFSAKTLDMAEGSASQYVYFEDEIVDSTTLPKFATGDGGIQIGEGASGRLKDFTFVRTFEADAYVFCASERYAPDELLPKIQDADSCVEITDPRGFVLAMHMLMRTHGAFVGSARCQYVGRMRRYTEVPVHPFVAKEVEDSYFAEIRSGWVPREPILVPYVDITNIDLCKYCRRIL